MAPSSRSDVDDLLFLAEHGAAVPETDVHGLEWDQAREDAERLVQSAFVRGERAVRIIHGKGEGRLRERLSAWLERHPLVLARTECAGGGATAAVLAPSRSASRAV